MQDGLRVSLIIAMCGIAVVFWRVGLVLKLHPFYALLACVLIIIAASITAATAAISPRRSSRIRKRWTFGSIVLLLAGIFGAMQLPGAYLSP